MAMTSKETLSTRLKELMALRPDLDSQNKIGKRTGLAQSTVGRVLNKVNAADIDVLDKLAEAFGVRSSDLLSNDAKNIHLLSLLQQVNEKETQEVILFIEFMIKKRQNASAGADFESETSLSRGEAAAVGRASARSLDVGHESESSHERTRKRS